jgi:hypothetical protein
MSSSSSTMSTRLMAVTVDGFCDGLVPRWQR